MHAFYEAGEIGKGDGRSGLVGIAAHRERIDLLVRKSQFFVFFPVEALCAMRGGAVEVHAADVSC